MSAIRAAWVSECPFWSAAARYSNDEGTLGSCWRYFAQARKLHLVAQITFLSLIAGEIMGNAPSGREERAFPQ